MNFKKDSSGNFLLVEQYGTKLTFPYPVSSFVLYSMVRDNAGKIVDMNPHIESVEDAASFLEKIGVAKFQHSGGHLDG